MGFNTLRKNCDKREGTSDMSNSSLDKLAALRAKLKEKNAAQGGTTGDGGTSPFYKFFAINFDESATLRFLPDGDKDPQIPDEFWKEKMMYEWNFADPENPGQEIKVYIPDRNMYEHYSDPVHKKISDLFNTDKETAQKFWVKRSYIYQGFVRKSPLQEDTVPDNPIRLFDISKNIHNKIYSAVMNENEELSLPAYPTDFETGLNFLVTKKKNAFNKADYNSSAFSQKPTPLTEDELAAIEQHGLWSLSKVLPPMPSDEAYEVVPAILEAGINGDPWNPEWSKFFRTYAARNVGKPESEMEQSFKADEEDATEEEDIKPAAANPKTTELLAKLRNASKG